MDFELLRRFQSGDEDAFSASVDEYAQALFAFCLRIVRDRALAEDCVQETFVKAWKNAQQYRLSQSFKAWIFTIAHNSAIDLLRRKKTLPFSAFDRSEEENVITETTADEALLPDELYDRAILHDSLGRILSELPISHREVLMLHYQNDLTFEEIGIVLGKPMNTVKSIHRRALSAVRKKLSEAM